MTPWMNLEDITLTEISQSQESKILHNFIFTCGANLHVTKRNVCYVPGFPSLNKTLPPLAQIDVWSMYLDPFFAIYSKGRLKT